MPLPFFKARQKTEETSLSFLENGSSLLEELIASFGGRYRNPIRCFTAKELISATNNFTEKIKLTDSGSMFQGFLEGQRILVKKFSDREVSSRAFRGAVRDISVSSQMSHFKNILKLRGCCLEFKIPTLLYEHAGTELLADLLHRPVNKKSLSWEKRMQIAKGIASAIAYLHTAFPSPIIYRDLKPSKVFIDKDGIPKLFNFSLSISLPPGESQVEDVVMGTWGYADPDYLASGIITQKTDVYSFGVLLLVLLTGEEAICKNHGGENICVVDHVKYHVDKDKFDDILDSNIWEEEKVKYKKQILAFLNLAMKCTHSKGEDRPYMVQVAKEICRMEKAIYT